MPQLSLTRRKVNRVFIITLILNLAVSAGKIILGVTTGAAAITADGFHSLADGFSNVVALVANTIAGAPPDDDHPYGHQRFETLATLAIGLLLILTVWEILREILGSFNDPEPIILTPLAFVVMIVTLIVNIAVNRYQVWQGHRLNSDLLLADAAHTGTDIFVTISVLCSMALVTGLGWLWADRVMALIVVVFILRTAWTILRQAGRVLVDTAPFSPEDLAALISTILPADQIMRVRSRGAVGAAFIDVDVQIPRETPIDYTASLAAAIERHLKANLPGVEEVEVHFVPRVSNERDYALIVRTSADPLGLKTHNVVLNYAEEGLVLEFHVEVPPEQTLESAHQQATQLEAQIQRQLPELATVVSHIEPAPQNIPDSETYSAERCARVRQRAYDLLLAHYPDANWHDLRIYRQSHGLNLTMHVELPSSMPISSAHELTSVAERLLRQGLPELDRITIHTEPRQRI